MLLSKSFLSLKQMVIMMMFSAIATKVVCFSHLLKCLRMFKKPQWQTVWTQIRLLLYEAVCSGSMLFASVLNSSVMLGNYLQQTTSAIDIVKCIFFLGAIRVKADGHYDDVLCKLVEKFFSEREEQEGPN